MIVPDALTEGETLFEKACASKGIHCRRIPVAKVQGHRRPDYKVRIAGCGAIVEVKQIEPNAADLRYEQELETRRHAVRSQTPGERLRGAIRASAGQLRRASRLGVPTAVAIFDNTGSLSYTDPYNVKVAMDGLDAVVIAVEDTGPDRIRMKRAGKAVLTDQHNTSVSAVIIIRDLPKEAPLLIVYHNRFARVHFDRDHLRDHVFAQFALGSADDGTRDWVKL